MSRIILIYATAPDVETAARIAEALIEARAAACVNIIPGVRSIYRWKGEIERAGEVALIAKTTAAASERALAVIRAAHPYETPAISTFPAAVGEDFMRWVVEGTMA